MSFLAISQPSVFHDCDGMLDKNTLGDKGLFGSQSVCGCLSAIAFKTVARESHHGKRVGEKSRKWGGGRRHEAHHLKAPF